VKLKRWGFGAMSKECLFCSKYDDKTLIYKDDSCYATISLNPINKYHVLIIPHKHYESFIDLPDELASHLFIIAKKISKAVRLVCSPDAVTHLSDDDISN
jgi:histidine triad (HIT) family protein